MQYYFQDTFITEVKKLLKKKSYKDCEKALISDIFDLSVEDVLANCSAFRLNAGAKNPIAKLRISYDSGKSSGYRVYVFAMIIDEKLFFAHVYPKTGTYGQHSLSAKEEVLKIKNLLADIKSDNLAAVYVDKKQSKIYYAPNNKTIF